MCKKCTTQKATHMHASDRQVRQKRILRTRVYKGLHGANKSASTTELLGRSIEESELHLEAHFWPADDTHPAMSWSNQGLRHCDHIIPCSSFDLDDPAQQQQCFNFKSLQPLWAQDNIAKGDRLDWQPNNHARDQGSKIDWHDAAGMHVVHMLDSFIH